MLMPDGLQHPPVPVSSADTDLVAGPVTEVYADGEVALLSLIAAAVAAGVVASATNRLTSLYTFRRQVAGFVRRLVSFGVEAGADALDAAARTGERSAQRSVSHRHPATPASAAASAGNDLSPTLVLPAASGNHHHHTGTPGTPTVDDLRRTAPRGPRTDRGVTIRTPDALRPQLHAMAPQMLLAAEGMYQQVMTQVLHSPLDSDAARLRLAQQLLDRAAAKGLTGFVDSGGRRWSMVSYVEMLTRTAAAHTAIDAHTALIAAHGYDLVRVSVHANCSPMCAPFQGHLLSVTGATTNEGPEPWRNRVVTSLPAARTRGFNHPNCKHWVTLWAPGDPLPAAPDVDPGDYVADQQLRALERRLRAARRVQAVAFDAPARGKATARVSALRTQVKAHVAAHTTVVRKPHREQIDGAL